MKSRDEIVIIMLQWMRLYTLGSRGSRELNTFLEICLISSRIDQKLKNNQKEKLAQKSWLIGAVMGVVFKRRGSGLHSAASWRQILGESA